MPSLKFSLLASVYPKPRKWVRGATTTPTSTVAARHNSLAALNSRQERILAAAPGWRISPCTALSLPAHDKAWYGNLGFRGHKIFYSSGDRGGEESGGAVADTSSDIKGANFSPEEIPPASQSHYRHSRQPPVPPLERHQQQSEKLLTLPTVLTITRVAAVPLLVGTFYVNNWWGTTATTSIFIAASITDWLDGYIARKMRLSSAFGAFLDPVADKLMVAATLVLLCTRHPEVPMFGQVPWLLTLPAIAIIGREITMSAVREWAASQNSRLLEAVAVNNLGKWKTATQMIALTILLATRDKSFSGADTLVASGVVLLYISAGLAVWSLGVYMRKIWKVLLK